MARTRFTTRPSVRIGPARISANIGKNGLSSLSLRAFGLSFNSPVGANARRQSRPGLSSVDLPGPISIRPSRRRG